MMKPIEVAVTLNARSEEVFVAFVQDINEWWPVEAHSVAQGTVDFEPGINGEITETLKSGGKQVWGHVTAWHEFRHIALSWYPGASREHGTDIVIRFETTDGKQILLTLVHSGWRPDDDLASKRRDNYQIGWTKILGECFANHIEKSKSRRQHRECR